MAKLLLGEEVILNDLSLCDTYFKRLRGLMGLDVDKESGVIILPCNSIHTMFMKEPIDVLFLDDNGIIIKTLWNVAPWRIIGIVKEAVSVVEGKAGVFSKLLRVGDKVYIQP